MSIEDIYCRLLKIENLLVEQNLLQKEVLNFAQAASYLDVSNSHLYKLTSSSTIPCYKPNGKKLYFNREELDKWLLSNRQDSLDEINRKADDYLIKNPRTKI